MNNFYQGGRGLAFSLREGETSSRKEKPPRLSKILTHPAGEGVLGLPSATVRPVVDVSSKYPRDLFDTGSGAVREVFDCCSGATRRRTEAHPKQYRSCPEPVPKRTRSVSEGHPNSTRRNRWFFGGRRQNNLLVTYFSLYLCFLDKYRCSRRIFSWITMKDKSMPLIWALICFMLFNLSTAWAQSAESRTAEGQTEIKSLQIGDTIPEEVWNMPLQIVNHPKGKDTITLNDYRDKKLIILDFWATWCGSCLASMPYMHELETETGKQAKLLPVTFQDHKTILDFLNKSVSPTITAIKSSFSSIVDGKVLDAYFPSKSIPHVVVLDTRGRVRAISVPSALNVENLEEMIADGNAEPVRQRMQTIDSPLLSDGAGTDGIYYSAFLPYNAAMPFTTSFRTDSAKRHAHYYSLNTRLIKLFGHAVFVGDENVKHTGIHLLPSRRIFEVADPALYDQNNDEYPLEKVMFTYESVMSFGTTIDEVKQKIGKDLEAHFGIRACLEKIKVPCLVLTVADTSKIPYAKDDLQRKLVRKGVTVLNGGYEVLDQPSRNRSSSYLQNYPITQLVYMLNKLADGKTPFVIDETGIRRNLDLDIVDNLSDFYKLQEVLFLQGIKIEKEEREQMMFVLKDANYRKRSTQLELTPSGYVYREEEEGSL